MRHLIIILSLLAITFSCNKPINEWSKWRGPKGDAVSTETNWSYEKLDSANILWTKNIGKGHSAISVVGTHCYASGWKEKITGTDTTASSSVFCFNVRDGKQVWEFNYPSAKRSYPGPRATPVVDGDRLYQISWAGTLYCIDRHNGREIWKKDLAADSLTVQDEWGYCPSPVIYNDLLLLNLNESGIALNKMNGDVVWNSNFKQSTFASVQLFTRNENTLGLFSSDTILSVVDVKSGKIVSRYKRSNDLAVSNDIIFTSGGDLFASNELLKYSGDSLIKIWQNDTITSFFQTGVVMDGFAFQFARNKKKAFFCCVDLKDGTPKWSQKFGAWGSVLGIDDKIVIITGLGKIIIAEANPSEFKELKSLQVLPSEDKPHNWCWTMPTFVDGKLYVRNSNGDMACIDLGL